MLNYVYEILDSVNKAEPHLRTEKLRGVLKNAALKMLLNYNFDDVKMILPEGMPPYKRDEVHHPDMFETTLVHEARRLYIFREDSAVAHKMKKADRENRFIQILEGIPPKEADILCAIKDKSLTELYPNITKELFLEASK